MMNPKIKSLLNRIRYAFLPAARVGICRVRHDRESARIRGGGQYPYLSRFYDGKGGLPETVRFYGGKGNVRLAQVWQEFFEENNTNQAQKYLKRLQSGWVNYGPWPKIEQICCASPDGTYVVVNKIIGNRAYINCYDNSKIPADYQTDYLQQFGVAYPDDSIGLPPCGPAFTFAIKNPDELLWMHTDDLTFIR
jgi:hypothetical protein